nr:G protein-coupled receptor [Proales similis]
MMQQNSSNAAGPSEAIQTQESGYSAFELKIAILITITFGITIIVGIVGNLLVLLTIVLRKQMRSTTNILILNLAVAELLFILLCVPFTGLNYVLSVWYFGDVICKVVQYTSNVTAYVIILSLVLMSLDRYLAIRDLVGSSIRNQRNTILAIAVLWISVLILNLPHLFLWREHSYEIGNSHRTVCILEYNIIISNTSASESALTRAEYSLRAYYSIFFLAGYVIPFVLIAVIYSLIMLKLRRAHGQQVSKSKRKVTFMVIVVVSSFVLCWGPLQVMLFLQHVMNMQLQETGIIVLVISNCIAYLNTCINPIIYGFANQDFRFAYAAILKCNINQRKYIAVGTQINRHELTQLNGTQTPATVASIRLKSVNA